MQVILNIGLNQSNNFPPNAYLTSFNNFLKVSTDVLTRHGTIVKHKFKTVTHEQGTEVTLIVLLTLKHHTEYRIDCFESDIKNLATKLNQDCISICYLTGKLLGQYTDSWGNFNLNYFHFSA